MSPRHRRLLPWLALLVVYVVWGSTYMAIRIAVREMPPFAAAAMRFGASGLVMAAIAFFVDREHGRPTRRQLADYALVGVLLLAFGNAMVMWAEQRISSGITALIVGMVPTWLTLFDGLRPQGQPWTLRVWLGVMVGMAGVALVARPGGGIEAGHWPAVAMLMLASIAWSIGSLYSQSVPRRLPLFSAAAVEMIAGALLLAVESRLMREDLARFVSASPPAWLALVYLAVFGSLVGFTAFAFCLNELPATTVGTYAYVNPVVAVLLGSVFLGEPVSAGLVAGAVLILGAVLLTTTRRRPPRRVQEPTAPVPSEATSS
ncbi:MAG: EamA family transporter [Acidobacteria bacterium]|nr:MAG: EamA family transporter [Acidobacteriota bacterium]